MSTAQLSHYARQRPPPVQLIDDSHPTPPFLRPFNSSDRIKSGLRNCLHPLRAIERSGALLEQVRRAQLATPTHPDATDSFREIESQTNTSTGAADPQITRLSFFSDLQEAPLAPTREH